jgi:hypothetical protein
VDTDTVMAIIAIVGTVSGVVIGWATRSRTVKQDAAGEAAKDATLQADMAYLKRGVDDMNVKIDLHGQRYDKLSETVIRMDESIKSAHKRIDKFERERLQ